MNEYPKNIVARCIEDPLDTKPEHCELPEKMQHWTLDQTAIALEQGRITRHEADIYIHKWNTTTVRFTQAYRIGDSIHQRQ